MEKYYGVHVELVLKNNDIVTGHIHGTDGKGIVTIKNASTQRANGYSSRDEMLPIMIDLIEKLNITDMNTEQQKAPQQQAPPPQQPQPTQPTQQQLYMQQQQQHFHPMQPHLHFPPPPQQAFPQMHPYHSPMQFHPSPHAPHVDPAILFHHSMQQQANSPLMHRDPAIVSTQQPNDRQAKNGKLSMNEGGHMNNIDPAILFSQSASTQPKEQSPPTVQKMFEQQQPLKQGKQKQAQSVSNLKSLDPSILFEQKSETPSPQVPFQDPAIISVTSTPEIKEKPKKPLFGNGGKKVKKTVKEVVVFEDYSDFESGKGGVKKTPVNNKKDVNVSSNTSSGTSTPNPKKKNATREDVTEVVSNTKSSKQSNKSAKNPPVEILSKPLNTSSHSNLIPSSLIPPKARRNNSSSSQVPQLQQKSPADGKSTVGTPRILTVSGGIEIPTVTLGQMESAKNIARETGLTQAQLVENGAFGISMMALKVVGGHRRIQPDNHNAAPVVVILVGPTSIGEYGIAAARHLANRGCQVIISVTDDSYCGATVEQYKALAKFSGARIVSSTSELPNQYTTPVDLIVDALLGSDIKKMSPAIKHQMNWANSNKAPVLSVDFPSGVYPDNGALPNSSANHITPKWTLCLGAPYTGCTSRNITGELFLVDAGLPFTCFQPVFHDFHIPWGSEFVLALEYA